ncbi:hypothetical protein [Leptothoe spongobia]|uniref:Uncharacterized protein n=1 Tax=Leptothoe spongobia TAU-MAC 1115 TaxID=1967444 RepID=A0A947DH21_9CYAN|nr:hypothetical protein [Leptothoe spongobia]MBT9316726.1 hypothetical protein [Leptothoe spongobia TAU-MAC 1115]
MSLAELPGKELILPGLEDLHKGQTNTIGALLIAISSMRLTAAGLEFPKDHLVTADIPHSQLSQSGIKSESLFHRDFECLNSSLELF